MKQFLDGLAVATITAMCSHLLITYYQNEKANKKETVGPGSNNNNDPDVPVNGFTVKRIRQDSDGAA